MGSLQEPQPSILCHQKCLSNPQPELLAFPEYSQGDLEPTGQCNLNYSRQNPSGLSTRCPQNSRSCDKNMPQAPQESSEQCWGGGSHQQRRAILSHHGISQGADAYKGCQLGDRVNDCCKTCRERDTEAALAFTSPPVHLRETMRTAQPQTTCLKVETSNQSPDIF